MPDDFYLDKFNKRYIFPVQFVIGCIGNILNLVVLNSRGMRTKTNCFLSAMAVADLGFFLAMLPVNLQTGYGIMSYSPNHRLFFLYSHILLVACANWFSAASIWLTIGVTVERLIAIKFPLLARTYWKKCRIIMSIVAVYVLALVVSLYHFAWRGVKQDFVPNNTRDPTDNTTVSGRLEYTWSVAHSNETILYYYVHISHGFFAISVILLPLATLIILSSCLVYYLRLNTHAVRGLRAGSALLRKGERRVTWTVVVLILAFTLFNFPSGVFAIIEIYLHKASVDYKRRLGWYFDMAEIVNALVCMNKAINFGLYCSASSGFRRKLVSLITRHRFCGRVVRTLSTRFSISSGNGDCGNPTVTCKYSVMTTVFHETRCCSGGGDHRHHHNNHELITVGRANGHAFLQRRAQSIDARGRTPSNTLQLHQFQRSHFSPARARTCSAL